MHDVALLNSVSNIEIYQFLVILLTTENGVFYSYNSNSNKIVGNMYSPNCLYHLRIPVKYIHDIMLALIFRRDQFRHWRSAFAFAGLKQHLSEKKKIVCRRIFTLVPHVSPLFVDVKNVKSESF